MSGGEILARLAAEAANPQWEVLIYNGSLTLSTCSTSRRPCCAGWSRANLGNLNDTGMTYLPENRSLVP